MRACFVIGAMLIAALSGRSPTVQRRLVNQARKLPASAIDPSQPAVPLEEWLRSALGPNATIDWDISDCDLQPDFSKPAATYRMCVVVRSKQEGSIGLKLHISAGTLGHPSLSHAAVQRQSFMMRTCPGTSAPPKFAGVESLSDIPRSLAKLSSEPCP